MDSILKLSFRQTDQLLRLTKTILHAYRLQRVLANDSLNLFEKKIDDHCAFSHDLCNELRLIQKQLHSTCFLLQQALYRLQALRQNRGDVFIRIQKSILNRYEEYLAPQLKLTQQTISSIIEENMLTNSALNTLRQLFKQIQENFDIFIEFISQMPTLKSTLYLGNLVSDTLERFYLILGTLARLVNDIEEFELE